MIRMKSTYLFFWLSFLLIACQETPEFPDPKFDSTDTRIYEVRRDTADFEAERRLYQLQDPECDQCSEAFFPQETAGDHI